MSRALPVARSPATSSRTTSATSAWASSSPAVAPTLPPPPTTVTLLRISIPSPLLKVVHDGVGEFRGLQQGGPFRQPLQIVGDPLLLDGPAEGRFDPVGRFVPA